jgi:hypothetical protein
MAFVLEAEFSLTWLSELGNHPQEVMNRQPVSTTIVTTT